MKIEATPNMERKSDAEYLKLLQDRLDSLSRELEITKGQRQEVAKTPTDSADEFGDRQNELRTLEETIDGAKNQIDEVEKTIRWAKEHGFVCAICGKEIETDRLEADLASIACKEHRSEEDGIEV